MGRLLVLLGVCVGAAVPAEAVVPGLAGPLQALGALLPQLLAVLAGFLAALISVPAWKRRTLALLAEGRKRPLLSLAALGAVGWGSYALLSGSPARVGGDAGSAVLTGAWPAFRGGPLRLGTEDGRPVAARPVVLWRHGESGGGGVTDFSSSPAALKGRIYVGSAQASVFSSGGAVHCIDAATRKTIWRTPTAQQVFSSPVVADGRVYCGEGLHQDTGSRLYCLDSRTGRVLWSFPTGSHLESTPAVAEGRVVFTAGDDGVYCLDARTGARLWRKGGLHADVSPAVADGRVYVGTGYGRYRTLCLDLKSGKVLWDREQDLAVWGPPAVSGGSVYFGLGNGDFTRSHPDPKGRVLCASVEDGRELWRLDVPDAVLTAVALHEGRATFGSRDGRVYTVAADRGRPVWQARVGAPVLGSPAVSGGRVYAVGGDGSVRCLSAATGAEEWALKQVSRSGFLSSPAVSGGRLYVGSPSGDFLCIGAR